MNLAKMPDWLYRWLDNRGRLPWIIRKLYPKAHFCPELDGLLEDYRFCPCTTDTILMRSGMIEAFRDLLNSKTTFPKDP